MGRTGEGCAAELGLVLLLLDICPLWDCELRLPDLSANGPIKENPEGKVKRPD